MRLQYRKTAPRVRSGKVLGYRHVLRKSDICRFIGLLPDWAELSKGLKSRDQGFLLGHYVNDRPYVASSFMSVAIAQVLGSAAHRRPSSELGRKIQSLIAGATDDAALLQSILAALADVSALDEDVFGLLKPLHGCGGSEGYVLDVEPAEEAAFWMALAEKFQDHQGICYIAADAALLDENLRAATKHETPVAYASERLPQMDKLKEVATRPLNSFERGAIDRLRTDEDLVIDESPNRIRMMGSLRAGKNCLDCHSVRRGELLGAFSYELVPERPVPVPKNDGKPLGPQA